MPTKKRSSTTKSPKAKKTAFIKPQRAWLNKKSVISLLIFIAFFAVIGSILWLPARASDVAVVNDDFATSAADFTTVAGGTWAVGGGAYNLTNPQVPATATFGNANYAINKLSIAGNFTEEFDSKVTDTSSTFNDSSAIFDWTDASNYYYASFNESTDLNSDGIFRISNGVQTRLLGFSATFAPNTWRHIKVVRSDKTITVSAGGTVVGTTTDANLPAAGRMGFGTRNDSASFDNFKISVPDHTPPSIPSGLSATKTATSATITWAASTDNVGVAGYRIFRGSTAIATTQSKTYTDSNLQPGTYNYSVTAYDASGNESAKSTTLTVSITVPTFQLGVTKPRLDNPAAPTANDNVGAAFGWNGVTLQDMSGDQTIPANTTWTNRRIHGFVTFTDSTSRLVNSVVDGRAPGGAFQSGLVDGDKGGYLDRVTLRASTAAAAYYLNGLTSTGGTWTLNRCDISRVVDSVHANGSGGIKLLGSHMHDYSFWATDQDHATDSVHPYWSHGDVGIQRLTGNANTDRIEGSSIQGFFDTTGVTWSGGSWGSGKASGGQFGTPSTALNNGYPNRNYANLISYTNTTPYTGMVFINNWLDGGSYPSGMVQITNAGNHSFQLSGNRFGLGGKAGGSSDKMYLATYGSTAKVNFSPSPNVYDNINDVPAALRNQPLTITSGGAAVALSSYQ